MFGLKKTEKKRARKHFTDNRGRLWDVSVTVNTIKRVRDLVGVDLSDGITAIEAVSSDPVELCNVLFAICKPQADKAEVSDEHFGESLVGDVLGDAVDAFIEGVVDFFPEAKRRVLRAILEKSRATEMKIMEALDLNLANPELDQMIMDQLRRSTT